MKNIKIRDFIYLGIITIAFIGLVLFLTNGMYLYGSTLDWYAQHISIPEYFRTLFYDTKDLFPDFAANIGAGQNIYNFSYYGFLSPIVLISYLLPKVSMTTYMIISTIISVIISTYLIYFFLKKKGYSSEVCFLSSLIFIMSAPMTLHSHRHIMFITYMPFLILGLFGVDKKIDNNKGWLLTLSTFLMIMTNYYFSIGGILCLFIYALHRYLQKMNKVTIKSFFQTFFSILVPILVAILCSSIILLPTLATLLNNRADSNISISLKELLIPSINSKNFLYYSYGLGLCAIIIPALINMYRKNKANITLGIILTLIVVFNLFNYILNGTMYIDAKSLIPLLPLYIYVIAEFLSDLFSKKLNYKILIPALIIISVLVYLNKYSYERYFGEIALLIITFIIYLKIPKKAIIIVPLSIFIIANSYIMNTSDELVLKYTSAENEELLKDDISSITSSDDGKYRISNDLNVTEYPNRIFDNINYYNKTIYSSISNQTYNKLYYDVLENNIAARNRALTVTTPNLLSLMLHGDKYVISRNKPLHGYEQISTNKGLNIYKNENVLPLGFATSNVMSYEDFDKLSDQVKQEALLNVIVADTETKNNFVANTQKIDLDFVKILEHENIKIEEDGSLTIDTKESIKISYELPEKYKNKIIFIRFKMNHAERNKDLVIKINNVKNKLTASSWKYYNNNEIFDYVLATQEQDKLVFNISEGKFNISDFESYVLDYASIEKCSQYVSKFIINNEETKGDKIKGDINIPEDSYFMLTIPYDKGFKIKIDNKETNYELVDHGFIGFKVGEGTHDIEIEYQAPMKKDSLLISSFGFIMFIIITILESKRKI